MDLNKLDEPFSASDIEWRVQQCGIAKSGPWAMVLAYVTNRAIMKRLDDVCGKSGWRNEYRDIPNNGGVECGISIKVDGEWITKWDAAENTQVEAVKGGRSGAMKRAAVQWGIGRYLYQLEERFATCSVERTNGWNKASFKDKKTNQYTNIWWQTPDLPGWALPAESTENKANSVQQAEPSNKSVTPEDADKILAEFSSYAGKEIEIKKLTEQYKSTWAALNGFPDHQEKCKDVTGIRRAELTQQTQAA